LNEQRDSGDALTPELASTIARAKREIEGMIDLYPQGMILVDGDMKVRRVNQGLLTLLGYERFNEVLGKGLGEVFAHHSSVTDCPVCAIIADVREGKTDPSKPTELAFDIMGKGKRTLSFTIVSAEGSEGSMAALVEDVTEDTKLGEEAIRRGKMEAAGELVGALNHQINQSLGVIQGRAQLLLFVQDRGGSVANDELRRTLEDIINHTRRIADVLKKAMNLQDYVTEEYISGVKILDLEGSSREGQADGKNTTSH
jgi:nitrogen-specific signal transduction histidine kinase